MKRRMRNGEEEKMVKRASGKMIVQGKDDHLRIVRLVMDVGEARSVYVEALKRAGAVCHFEYTRIDGRGRFVSEGYL